jgi:hypothetical protein
MPWHVHVVSLGAGGSRLKVKGGFTGYALRTGEICRVMSQMKTRLKGSVVLRLLWPHYFSALAAWRCAPQSAEHRGVKRKTAPGSAWGTLPGAALGLCGCVGPSYPRPVAPAYPRNRHTRAFARCCPSRQSRRPISSTVQGGGNGGLSPKPKYDEQRQHDGVNCKCARAQHSCC